LPHDVHRVLACRSGWRPFDVIDKLKFIGQENYKNMLIGTVQQIWRYPVKSMAGERLERSAIDPGGLPGDRSWAVKTRTPDCEPRLG